MTDEPFNLRGGQASGVRIGQEQSVHESNQGAFSVPKAANPIDQTRNATVARVQSR
jgi:hypothetical protein